MKPKAENNVLSATAYTLALTWGIKRRNKWQNRPLFIATGLIEKQLGLQNLRGGIYPVTISLSTTG